MTHVRARRLALGAVVGSLLLLAAPPVTGQAATSHGNAKIIRVMDGDTVDVDRNFDGRIDARVRLLGIDSPEHGVCGFKAATQALKSLVRHKVVTLSSDTGQTGKMNRLERRVTVTVAGKKVDASTWMLERGWGVWMPRAGELTHSLAQHKAADRAAAAGLGWFDADRCGTGPYVEGSLRMQVSYEADTAKWMSPTAIRNEEFIRILNDGTEPVNIDRWTLRVGNDRDRVVPAGGPIPPGGFADIHVGFGTNSATHRYLGSPIPMLVNASIDGGRHLGSGSYLLDPDYDIRAHMTWPCTLNCADPTGGALVLSDVNFDPPGPDSADREYIVITNRGNVPVRTGDLVLEVRPYDYELPPDHQLEPGETLTVRVGGGTDERLVRYLNSNKPALIQSAGRALLRTYDAIVIDCIAWGSTRCPPGS